MNTTDENWDGKPSICFCRIRGEDQNFSLERREGMPMRMAQILFWGVRAAEGFAKILSVICGSKAEF